MLVWGCGVRAWDVCVSECMCVFVCVCTRVCAHTHTSIVDAV